MANSFVKNVEDFVRSHIIAAFVGSGILLVAGVALRPLAEGHGLFAFDTFVWAVGVVFCALLVVIVSTYLRELLLALAAMWKPLLVVGAGFLFLILNDQGRELGVSLMDESGSPWSARRLALFLALIYWAVNNWHSARLGLGRAFPNPHGGETWLYWPSRLLGVCAHFFAALNLSLAALIQPEIVVRPAWAWTAPFAIIFITAIVWAIDSGWLSQRNRGDPKRLERAKIVGAAAVVCQIALLGGMTIEWRRNSIPEGLFWGTLWICASAMVFLLVISWLRRRAPIGPHVDAATREADQQAEERQRTYFTLALAAIAAAATIAVWTPLQIGRWAGSMVIAYFAFGAALAVVNFFEFALNYLTTTGSSGLRTTPRKLGAFALTFLVLLAVVTSFARPFHRVRLCKDDACKTAPAPAVAGWDFVKTPGARQTVDDAARAWYQQASRSYHEKHPGEPVPMLIVATAGGGIRAAYWTAVVLEKLESDFGGDLRPLLLAISGVSGGSVGAAAYMAAVAAQEKDGKGAVSPTAYLREDFLAEGLASWLFIDGISNVLPDLGQRDRGDALEQGFEHASGGLMADAFLSFFPDRKTAPLHWRPILLLNATHEETGRRIITSHVKVERDVFLDSYDALESVDSDVRLSTAAHNSARFTYVSPAGDLGRDLGYVIDGGYFENYGAPTALELARRAIKALEGEEVKLVVLQISSDPGLDKNEARVRILSSGSAKCLPSIAVPEAPNGTPDIFLELKTWGANVPYFNELTAPIVGIMSVREAHGTRAAAELASEICAEQPGSETGAKAEVLSEAGKQTVTQTTPAKGAGNAPHFAHLAMCNGKEDNEPSPVQPPLGWVLSTATQGQFQGILGKCGNPEELCELEAALGFAPGAATCSAPDVGLAQINHAQ